MLDFKSLASDWASSSSRGKEVDRDANGVEGLDGDA